MNTLAVMGINQGLNQIKNIIGNYQLDTSLENDNEILSRLKFLGCVERDEKIDVRHISKQPNNLTTKIYRTLLCPDNRANSLRFIRSVIYRSLEILMKNMRDENYENCKESSKGIIADLVKAKSGIMNLKFTYSDDTKYCCDMDVIIQQLAATLLCLQTDFKGLFDESTGGLFQKE